MIEYRRAAPPDAEAVAQLHARSWRQSYRGSFSDEFLDGDLRGRARRRSTRELAMMRAIVVAILALFLLASDSDPPGTEVVVVFTRTRFEPVAVEVRRGTRVTFHNMDSADDSCSVVASDGSFESPPLGRNGEWSHRFATKGVHEYFLKEHPETRGRAIVE